MIKNNIRLAALALAFPLLSHWGFSADVPKSNTGAEFDVAAIVWPAYQNEPRWKELGIFDHGNGEWQNVYEATPKFKGHNEPRKPLWGYGRDDDPVEVARQIDAAAAAGVNVFIYDWYWYCGRPFLENALNNGFLKAPNSQRMKFFLMWANHDVNGLWNRNMPVAVKNKKIWLSGVSDKEFREKLVPRFISYFKQPNHYMIDGKPVFAIYRFPAFVKDIGGEAVAKGALKYLEAECKKAGFAGIHLMVFGHLPESVESAGIKDPNGVMDWYGISSTTTYNWLYKMWKEITKNYLTYEKWFDMSKQFREESFRETKGRFFPNVSVGWDTNSRYPDGHVASYVKGSNPEAFKKALIETKDWVIKNNIHPRLITVNSWNEWTEGSYLMPDEEFGYGYLNACAEVFGKKNASGGEK